MTIHSDLTRILEAGVMLESSLPQRRNSLRLPGWDYGAGGSYLSTFCTAGKAPVLGRVEDGLMLLSALGLLVEAQVQASLAIRAELILYEHIVMPNHVHLLVGMAASAAHSATLSTFVGALKSSCTARARAAELWDSRPLWQRGYHDRIVRNEREFEAIRAYIVNNPANWPKDADYIRP